MMIDRNIAPDIKDALLFDIQLKPYQLTHLNNGVPVYIINAGAQDVVHIEWIAKAGNCFDEKAIISGVTNGLLKSGTKQKTSYEINEHVEFYGAYLNTSCNHEYASITLHSLNKHTNQVLPLVAELLTESVFPQKELDIYLTNRKQKLEVNLKKCDFVANRLIDELVYGFNHPYGKYSRLEDYDAVNQAEIVQFYKQYYQEGDYVIFVSGKINDQIINQLNQYFGSLSWNNNKYSIPQVATQPTQQKHHRIVNDEQAVQGAIRMAINFPNRHHPDFIIAQIVNNIFGGFFGSRLMSNIREDKGYTYGIHSYLQNHIQQGCWMISTEAGKDVCEATIHEVYVEMEKLCNDLVSAEELQVVQNYMLGSILADLDGPYQIMSRWKNYILNNLPNNYFEGVIDTIKSVTPQQIQHLAQQYLKKENFFELIVY